MHRDPRPPVDGLMTLRRALGEASGVLRFAEAVFVQVARAPGEPPDAAREGPVAIAIAGILTELDATPGPPTAGRSTGGPPTAADPAATGSEEGAARTLSRDPVLLAAFFQNVDLLYAADSPLADRVGAATMSAIALLEAEGG